MINLLKEIKWKKIILMILTGFILTPVNMSLIAGCQNREIIKEDIDEEVYNLSKDINKVSDKNDKDVEQQKITQEDIDREHSRWWVIYYKIQEDEDSAQGAEVFQALTEADEILTQEFNPGGESFTGAWYTLDLEGQYNLVKRRNELWEAVLVKYKGKQALKEIEGVWSLDEVPELWEKVNKQSEENSIQVN